MTGVESTNKLARLLGVEEDEAQLNRMRSLDNKKQAMNVPFQKNSGKLARLLGIKDTSIPRALKSKPSYQTLALASSPPSSEQPPSETDVLSDTQTPKDRKSTSIRSGSSSRSVRRPGYRPGWRPRRGKRNNYSHVSSRTPSERSSIIAAALGGHQRSSTGDNSLDLVVDGSGSSGVSGSASGSRESKSNLLDDEMEEGKGERRGEECKSSSPSSDTMVYMPDDRDSRSADNKEGSLMGRPMPLSTRPRQQTAPSFHPKLNEKTTQKQKRTRKLAYWALEKCFL